MIEAMTLTMVDAKLKGYSLAFVDSFGLQRLIPTFFTVESQITAEKEFPEYIAVFGIRSTKKVGIEQISLDEAIKAIRNRKILAYEIGNKYFINHRKAMKKHDIIIEEIKSTIIHNGMANGLLYYKTADNMCHIRTGSETICSWHDIVTMPMNLIVTVKTALEIVECNRHFDLIPGVLHVED